MIIAYQFDDSANLIGIKRIVTNLIGIKTTKSLSVYIALQLLFLNFLLLHVEINPEYFPYLFQQIRERNLQAQRDGNIGEKDILLICNHFSKLDRNNFGKITLPNL